MYLVAAWNRILEYHQTEGLLHRRLKKYFLTILILSLSLSNTIAQKETDSAIFKTLKNKNLPDSIRLNLTLQLGQSYNDQERQEAETPLLQAKQLASNIGNKQKLSIALEQLGKFYFLRGNIKNAIHHFDSLLAIGSALNEIKFLASANKGLGIINFNQGVYEVAIKQMDLAYSYYSKLQDLDNMAKCCLNLGIFFSINGNPDEVINYYRKAESLFRRAKSEYGVAKAQHSLASAYYNKKDYNTAIHFLNLSVAAYKKLENEVEVVAQSGLKALIQQKLNQPEAALGTIKKGLAEAEKYNDIALKFELYLAGAEVAQNLNKTDLQLDYANQLLEITKNTDNKQKIAAALRFQADALAKKGDYKNSYYKLEQERKISDSINDANFQARISAIETHYKIKQKDNQISDLESTTRIQETTLDDKNNQLLGLTFLIGALINFILAAVWFYFQDKKIRKQLELNQIELSARNQQLDALNVSKSKLFQIMAHDLRGPIGSLVHLPTIYDNLFKAQDLNAINEMNQVVFKTMKQLHQLLDSLLAWATAESGQINITPQWIKINDLFNAVNNLFAENLILKGLKLNLEFDEQAEIWADNNSTYTVIRNLIGNAIKFSHPDSEITLKAKKIGSWMAISVIDYGKGMPKELLDKLFVVGEGKKSVGTQGEKGTGLGLLIVKEMVLLNNGQIEVASEFGKGTTTTIWLPCKEDATQDVRPSIKLTSKII